MAAAPANGSNPAPGSAGQHQAAQFAGLLEQSRDLICASLDKAVAGMLDKANVPAGALTLLQRKRLELARALATDPSVLLLDEIAGGLTDAEVGEIVDTITSIHVDGVSIIWIEHIVHALLRVVDRMLAMDDGRLLIEGDPHDVMTSDAVRNVYLGGELE